VVGITGIFITASAVIQRDAPPESRGRVLSIMQAVMGVSYGFGIMFIGSIGDLTSLRIAFLAGSMLLPLGFFALTRRSPNWRRALDGDELAIERSVITPAR
jgi:MFS family permease